MNAKAAPLNQPHWLAGIDNRPRHSIGQVVALISEEFPALTASKLRYLEDVDVVVPQRTPAGYRKYSDADLERIRYCLRQQRETFKPLDAIRADLNRLDAGIDIGQRTSVARVVSDSGKLLAADKEQLTLVELVDATGVDESYIETLTKAGLLRLDYRGRFGAQAIAIVSLMRQLAGYGLEPRHLRSIGVNAARVADLIEQSVAVTGRPNAEQSRERARELTQVFCALAQALIRQAATTVEH